MALLTRKKTDRVYLQTSYIQHRLAGLVRRLNAAHDQVTGTPGLSLPEKVRLLRQEYRRAHVVSGLGVLVGEAMK
jgi:hypothetical protein